MEKISSYGDLTREMINTLKKGQIRNFESDRVEEYLKKSNADNIFKR